MDKRFGRIGASLNQQEEERHYNEELLRWTASIVAAYLSKNEIDVRQLPQVLDTVHAKLSALGQSSAWHLQSMTQTNAQTPSVAAENSVTPDHIICLEDGIRFKTLKRYLFRKYRLTPEQYRLKWGLPPDYPMVAPNYAAKRSALARKMGLGRKKRTAGRKKR